MDAFKIDLATLPKGRSAVELEADPSELGLEASAWDGPVRGRLVVEKSGDQVTVRGTLEAVTVQECVRCLGTAKIGLEAPFEVFAERSGGRRSAQEADLERDDYMKFHDGRQLDLREATRESLLLEVPMVPKCRPDCAGLCPRCGADLNQGACGCPPQTDSRWADLRKAERA